MLDRRKSVKRTDRWMDGQKDFPCVLHNFFLFGVATLLPLNLNHIPLREGTCTAHHLLPLGWYLVIYEPFGHPWWAPR